MLIPLALFAFLLLETQISNWPGSVMATAYRRVAAEEAQRVRELEDKLLEAFLISAKEHMALEELSALEEVIPLVEGKAPTLAISAFVRDLGWTDYFVGGEGSGSIGQGRPIEGIRFQLLDSELLGGVQGDAYVENLGWLGFVGQGQVAGTYDLSLIAEAFRFRLTGQLATYYDIYYRVYLQQAGWLDWAKNGQEAGSRYFGLNVESIEVKLLRQEAMDRPTNLRRPFIRPANFLLPYPFNPRSVSAILNVCPDRWLAQLEEDEATGFYFGTPFFFGDWRSPIGNPGFNEGVPGLQCTGFVWYTFVRVGADGSQVPHLNAALDTAGGWGDWLRRHDVHSYRFATEEEMIASGVLRRGDLIWIWDLNAPPGGLSNYHHIGIYWGDGHFWHSAPPYNQITHIFGLASRTAYTVLRLR